MSRLEEVALALSEPTPVQLSTLRAWVRSVVAQPAQAGTGGARLLVVSPLGVPEGWRLEARLASLGIPVLEKLRLRGWSRLATAIRVREADPTDGRLRLAALFEAAWEVLAPEGEGEAWVVSAADHARVERFKLPLRARMAHVRVEFGLPGTAPRLLTPFHLADANEALAEATRLAAAMRLQGS